MKNNKFKVNIFYHYALEYLTHATEDSEVMKIDITDEFWQELTKMIEKGEIIIININAKVREGKSTIGIMIAYIIYELLKKAGKRKKTDQFGMDNIARDEQEYSKLMRDPKTMNTVIVTDESNDLEQTGENVTVEKALMNVFSNVQAGRYVHRVCCSPKDIADPNADILLDIFSVDRKNYKTYCKVHYRFVHAGIEQRPLIGYIEIDVKPLIRNWEENVKKVYYKERKTAKDREYIEEQKKKDFYVEYIIRKYEKMELITREGIFKPRILDYAKVILECVTRLKVLTKQKAIVNANLVRNFIKMEMRKEKIPLSIVGEELATREALGVLDLYKSHWEISSKLTKATEKGEKSKTEDLKRMQKEILNAVKTQEAELERYKAINDKYHRKEERE